MSLEKHDLIHELPEYKQQIHELKMSNQHFSNLFAQYHETDKEVHNLESGAQTCDDNFLNERKKVRLSLKDQLLDMIKRHESSH